MEVGLMPSRSPSERSESNISGSAMETNRVLRAVTVGLRGDVRFDAPLKEWTSFRIGGPADVLVVPEDVEDLCRLLRQAHEAKISVFVVGGTNLLIRDGGIRGVVVSLSKLKAIADEPGSVVYAEGGVTMPILLQHTINRSLSGLEWSAGIPGTVAGCVVMNAGTRLGEMKDALKAISFVDPTGAITELPASAIPFTYRRAACHKALSWRLAPTQVRNEGADSNDGERLFALSKRYPTVEHAECRVRL